MVELMRDLAVWFGNLVIFVTDVIRLADVIRYRIVKLVTYTDVFRKHILLSLIIKSPNYQIIKLTIYFRGYVKNHA